MPQPSGNADNTDRKARLQTVVADCLRRINAGETIQAEEIVAANPDLMPELGDQLRRLECIERAEFERAAGSTAITPERWQRINEVFLKAVQLPTEERASLFDKECGDDSELRAGIESLLANDATMTSPFASSSDAKRTTILHLTEPSPVPPQIGHYRILRKIGEGGMGTVYEARQKKPDRTVALKIMNARFASDRMRFRFEHEVEVLGRLQHPGIAQIFEAGTFDPGSGPQPFFAMELIKGKPLTAWADQHELGTRQRLELMSKVCDAVEHAHQKGVIHRDLKPGNILVDESGQPKTLDFGVARATDSDLQSTTLRTDVGQIVGTVHYMSPEQAGGDPDELDTRSDVYALGVVTYELLTGSLPYDLRGKPLHEALRIVREADPTPLSSVNRALRGDVETIVAKALEKDKARRYPSASDLAAELRRYLRNEPIEARPPSTAYHLRKFVKRNKILAGGVVAVFVVLVAGIIGTGTALARESAALAREIVQRRLAQAAEQEQSRARQEAELARSSEEEQRKLAEQREKQATEARAQEKERADELEIVTKFQASMLSGIDAEQMGRGIFADLREGIRETLETRKSSEEDINKGLASFDALLAGVNATNLALKVVDQHVLSRAVETIEHDFADQPLVRAALQQTVAETYVRIGLYAPAMPLLEAALKTRREELGDDHPHTLTSINGMGHLLLSMGKYEEALPYHREALEGHRRVLGDDHPVTLQSITNMGVLLRSMGKLEEAMPHGREALQGHRRVLGDDHPSTLISIGNMGRLLWSMGKPVEALPYLRDALQGRRRVLGDNHQDTLTSINNMGFLLQSMGKLAEAEPYFRESLEGLRGVLGDDHPDTLISIGNMGGLLYSMGKTEEAEPYYREALEGNRRMLGDDHPNTLRSINNMGGLLKSMGKFEEAEPYCHEALEGRRRVLGDAHPDTLVSINNMGALLLSMGNLAQAEPLFAKAVQGARRSLPQGHWYLGVFLDDHGKCLTKVERYADAEAALLEAHGILEAALGAEHKRVIGSAKTLADLYDAWHAAEPDKGYDAQAAAWRAKLAEWQASTQPTTQTNSSPPTP